MKKPLTEPKHLRGMLLRALAYDIDVQYLNGKEMSLADTLSQAYLPQTCEGAQQEFEIINALTYLEMSDERMGEMRHTHKLRSSATTAEADYSTRLAKRQVPTTASCHTILQHP